MEKLIQKIQLQGYNLDQVYKLAFSNKSFDLSPEMEELVQMVKKKYLEKSNPRFEGFQICKKETRSDV